MARSALIGFLREIRLGLSVAGHPIPWPLVAPSLGRQCDGELETGENVNAIVRACRRNAEAGDNSERRAFRTRNDSIDLRAVAPAREDRVTRGVREGLRFAASCGRNP
jgi:hypothetical protein